MQQFDETLIFQQIRILEKRYESMANMLEKILNTVIEQESLNTQLFKIIGERLDIKELKND